MTGGKNLPESWNTAHSPLLKLRQESQVVREEVPDVGNLVSQHRDTFRSHPESKAGVFAGIVTSILENLRVDHPGAQDFNPVAVPVDRHVYTRLNEREEVTSESDFAVNTENSSSKLVKRTFEISERNSFVNC